MKNSKHLFGLSLLLALVLSGCNNPVAPSSEQSSEPEASSETTSAYEGDTSDASEPVSSEPVSSEPSSSEETVAEWPAEMQKDMMDVLGEVLLAYPLSDDSEYYGYEEDYAYNIGDYDPSLTDDEYAELLAPTLGDEWTELAYDDDEGMYYAEKEWETEEGALGEGAIWFYTATGNDGQAFFFHFDGVVKTPAACLEDWPEEAKTFMTETFGEILPFAEDVFPEEGEFAYGEDSFRFEVLADDDQPFVENYVAALSDTDFEVQASYSSISAQKEALLKVTFGDVEYDAIIDLEFGFDCDDEYNDIFYFEASIKMDIQYDTTFPEEALGAFFDTEDFALSIDELKDLVSPIESQEASVYVWQYYAGSFQLMGTSTLEKLNGLDDKFLAKEYGYSLEVYAESDDDIEEYDAVRRDGDEEPTLNSTYYGNFQSLTGEYNGELALEEAIGMFMLVINKQEAELEYSATLPEEFAEFGTIFPAVPTLGDEFGYAYAHEEEDGAAYFVLSVIDTGAVLEAYLKTLGEDGYELELNELYYYFLGMELYEYYDYFGGHAIEVMYYQGILTVYYIEFEPVTGVDFTADLSDYFYDEPTDEEAIFDFGAFSLDIEQGDSTIGVGNMSAAGEDTYKFLFGTKDGLRLYAGQTMTFYFGGELPAEIVITCTGADKNKLSVAEGGTGAASGATYTVTVDPTAECVTLTATAQTRIVGIELVQAQVAQSIKHTY